MSALTPEQVAVTICLSCKEHGASTGHHWADIYGPCGVHLEVGPPVAALITEAVDQARAEERERARALVLQPHVREATDQGPDFCRTCSDAITEWVPWPCDVVTKARHDCATCADCIHDGCRCCGCYDGACCQKPDAARIAHGEVSP